MLCTKEEREIIVKICERAEELGVSQGDRFTLIMDLENTHNTVGLNLEGLLAAENFDFSHDIVGIQAHINRETKELEDFFLPRYAAQENTNIDSIINKAKASAEAINSTGSEKQEQKDDKDVIK